MLTIGTDSYISREFADEYISSRYRSTSKERKRWEELQEADKEIILRQACAELDLLPFRGRKASQGQILAFPRLPYQYGRVEEIEPLSVKQAQVELALFLSDDKKQSEHEKRSDLQKQGVKSFSVGDLSESYSDSATGEKAIALVCEKSARLLKLYLSGGFSLC